MTITSIYSKYLTPLNLQRHMLSVAGVASLICDAVNAGGKTDVNQDLIVKASLLHDMGNILKFDFTRLDIFDSQDRNRIEELKHNQILFKEKYGSNPDIATLKIVEEVLTYSGRVEMSILNLIEESHWENLANYLETNRLDILICCYSDMRVGPFGVLTLEERIGDLKIRRPEESTKLDQLLVWGKQAERKVESLAGKSMSVINDEDVRDLFKKLSLVEI
jgi:hypothetical protein